MRFVHISVFLLISLSLVESKLSVRYPNELRDKFDKINGIDYVSLVAADKIDLERISIGTLIVAEPITACSDLTLPKTEDERVIHKPIIIARRGECSFAQKAHVAELAGAQMLIIVNSAQDIDPDAEHRKISNAHIEIVEISNREGTILIEYMQSIGNTDTVEIFFQLEPENSGVEIIKTNSSQVEAQFWYSSSDSTGGSYDFISTLKDISHQLGHLIDIQFHVVLYRCHTCMRADYKNPDESCVCAGKYCDPESKSAFHKGSKVIIEDLRQLCMLRTADQEYFWNFAQYYGENCITKDDDDIDDCIDSTYLTIGIPKGTIDDIKKCMTNSFTPKPSGPLEKTSGDNTLLSEEMDLQRKVGVSHYPAFYVNGNRYEGSLKNPKSVFEFICQHYINVPYPCASLTIGTTETSYSFGFSALMVIGTVGLMLLMIYWVRRMVRRKIMSEMKDEISNTIAQYTKFRDRSEA